MPEDATRREQQVLHVVAEDWLQRRAKHYVSLVVINALDQVPVAERWEAAGAVIDALYVRQQTGGLEPGDDEVIHMARSIQGSRRYGSLKKLRKTRREQRHALEIREATTSGGPDALERKLIEAEQLERVGAAFADLTPSEKTLLSRRYDEELTFREIGEVMGMSIKNAQRALKRVLKRIRRKFEKRGGLT